jgi:hypothetical protein
MHRIRDGLLAGALAGLLLVLLLFFDQGPGDQLILVARALGLDGHGGSQWIAALLVWVLGSILGGLFGALWRQPSPSLGRALLWGWVIGILWWVGLFLILGGLVQSLALSLYPLLLYLVLNLVYGLVLGSVYTTLQQARASQRA